MGELGFVFGVDGLGFSVNGVGGSAPETPVLLAHQRIVDCLLDTGVWIRA